MMTDHKSASPTGITFGFIGYASANTSALARAFEDEVLPLIAVHGGQVAFRGHRSPTEPDTLPAELHVIWFPHQSAFDAYLNDPRRAQIVAVYGEVFTAKTVVRMDPLDSAGPWSDFSS